MSSVSIPSAFTLPVTVTEKNLIQSLQNDKELQLLLQEAVKAQKEANGKSLKIEIRKDLEFDANFCEGLICIKDHQFDCMLAALIFELTNVIHQQRSAKLDDQVLNREITDCSVFVREQEHIEYEGLIRVFPHMKRISPGYTQLKESDLLNFNKYFATVLSTKHKEVFVRKYYQLHNQSIDSEINKINKKIQDLVVSEPLIPETWKEKKELSEKEKKLLVESDNINREINHLIAIRQNLSGKKSNLANSATYI